MPVHHIFEALMAIQYKGFADLEYEVHPDDPMPGVTKSFAYMRGVLAGMGYPAADNSKKIGSYPQQIRRAASCLCIPVSHGSFVASSRSCLDLYLLPRVPITLSREVRARNAQRGKPDGCSQAHD